MIMKKHTHNHDDTQKHPTSISLVNDILLQQNHSGLIRHIQGCPKPAKSVYKNKKTYSSTHLRSTTITR